jgi:tetratricopeptide (TPR) repeat protein
VDAGRVAVMGHSYGAQAVLGWRAQPGSPVDAAVFLDSAPAYAGFDAPEFARIKAALERNVESAAPVMLFAARDRHPKFEGFDAYLKFAPRYEAAAPSLEHNAFVSQGALGGDQATRRSYEAICAFILNFLDGYLRGDAQALERLHNAGSGGPVHVRYRTGAPAPPTGAQIARLYRAEGSPNPQTLAAFLKGADTGALAGAAAILMEAGETQQAIGLLKSAAHLHPRSAALGRALGDALRQSGDTKSALEAYERALALLPADDRLDEAAKAQLRVAIDAARTKM